MLSDDYIRPRRVRRAKDKQAPQYNDPAQELSPHLLHAIIIRPSTALFKPGKSEAFGESRSILDMPAGRVYLSCRSSNKETLMKIPLRCALLAFVLALLGFHLTGCQTAPGPTTGDATGTPDSAVASDTRTAALPPPPEWLAPRLSQGPEDGDPLKINWAGIVASPLTTDAMGRSVTNHRASVQMAHDGKRLYLQIQDYVDTATLAVDDVWQVQLARPAKLETITIAANDATVAPKGRDPVQVRIQKDPGMWTISLSVAIKTLSGAKSDAAPEAVRLNIVRRTVDSEAAVLALSPTYATAADQLATRLAVCRLE